MQLGINHISRDSIPTHHLFSIQAIGRRVSTQNLENPHVILDVPDVDPNQTPCIRIHDGCLNIIIIVLAYIPFMPFRQDDTVPL